MDEEHKIKLIKLVDRECKRRVFTLLSFSRIVWKASSILIIGLLIWLLLVLTNIVSTYFPELKPEAQLGYFLAYAALGIAILRVVISLYQSSQSEISMVNEQINHYFKKLSAKIEHKDKPLLKALIKMKCREFDFSLSDLYEEDKSLFDDKVLLKRLYET